MGPDTVSLPSEGARTGERAPRRRLSTSVRVALTVTLVLTVGVVALATVAYLRVSQRMNADIDRTLLREAEAYSAALGQPAKGADLTGQTRSYLQARASSYSATNPILLVRFADGRVLSNSSVKLEGAAANTAALEPATAVRDYLTLTFQGRTYRAVTVPVRDASGAKVAVFESALPTSLAGDVATQLLTTLVLAGSVIVVVGAIVSAWAARASLRPLRRAASTASQVGDSSLTRRIGYDGPDDEVGLLVSAINAMLDRLESSFGEQRRFTADASHELRTPLAVVAGHVELLKRGGLPDDERREELDLIAGEVDRMSRLVDDLLSLARLDAGKPRAHQPLELSTLLGEAAARARGLGDRLIEVKAPPDVWVSGEPDQLTQALLNLLGNAVVHTSPGGHVWLRATAGIGGVAIEVSDDGPGIRDEDLSRVFDRFYRAQGPRRGDRGGSGLGLAITKRLVELHAGTITASNRPDGGARFTVVLKRIPAPPESVTFGPRGRAGRGL